MLLKERNNQSEVGQITFHKFITSRKTGGQGLQFSQSVLFQRNVIIVVNIVETDNVRPVRILEKLLHQVRSDEPGASGNQYALVLQLNILIQHINLNNKPK